MYRVFIYPFGDSPKSGVKVFEHSSIEESLAYALSLHRSVFEPHEVTVENEGDVVVSLIANKPLYSSK